MTPDAVRGLQLAVALLLGLETGLAVERRPVEHRRRGRSPGHSPYRRVVAPGFDGGVGRWPWRYLEEPDAGVDVEAHQEHFQL